MLAKVSALNAPDHLSGWLLSSLLAPGALPKDLVEVQGDRLLLDQALHLRLQAGGQDPHQGLRGDLYLARFLWSPWGMSEIFSH